jgi:hypothetical protein
MHRSRGVSSFACSTQYKLCLCSREHTSTDKFAPELRSGS